MAQVIWSRQATEDLRNIFEYIANDAPLTAERFLLRIKNRVRSLSVNPFLGGYIFEVSAKEYRELLTFA
jgi:toxin ParE1/3/4